MAQLEEASGHARSTPHDGSRRRAPPSREAASLTRSPAPIDHIHRLQPHGGGFCEDLVLLKPACMLVGRQQTSQRSGGSAGPCSPPYTAQRSAAHPLPPLCPAPAEVGVAALAALGVKQTEIPARGGHEEAGRQERVADKVGFCLDEQPSGVGLQAAVGPAWWVEMDRQRSQDSPSAAASAGHGLNKAAART